MLEAVPPAAAYLSRRGVENPRLDAELLLAGVLRLKRLDLYLQFDRPLAPAEQANFRARLERRGRREPLQYVEGRASFRNLDLRVDRRVLIPRPETERLVEEVLRYAAGRQGLAVLDVCTGSGAIALSLASEGRFHRVVATDCSRDALRVAGANAREAGLNDKVELGHGDLFDPLGAGERFDVIVSNPPYVAEADRATLPPEVVGWEPAEALFAGDDGLAVIRRLVSEAPRHLLPGGLLALEAGLGQHEQVAALARGVPGYKEPVILPDLTGRQRFVLIEYREGRK